MTYGDNEDKQKGIITEDEAFISLENQIFNNFKDYRVEHLSKVNKFDPDFSITHIPTCRVKIGDFKTPSDRHENTGNLSVPYDMKSCGKNSEINFFIDGNLCKKNLFDEKMIALAVEDIKLIDKDYKYAIVEKSLTLAEFLDIKNFLN